MADRFPAEIYIGGKVPESKITNLILEINSQCVRSAYGNAIVEIADPEEDFQKAKSELLEYLLDERGFLFFCDDKARWGEFDDLERFCAMNEIDFTRSSSGYYEHSAEMAEYRKGMDDVCSCMATEQGNKLIQADVVQDLLDTTEVFEKNPGNAYHYQDKILEAREEVIKVMPVRVSPLEPFEIVADEDFYSAGDSVSVPSPIDGLDSWENEFTGRFLEIKEDSNGNKIAIVIDQEDNAFSVPLGEITKEY